MLKVVETKFCTAPAAVPPEPEQADGTLTIRRKAGCDPVHAAHTITYELQPATEALAIRVEASVGTLTAEKAGVIYSFLDRSGKPTDVSRKAFLPCRNSMNSLANFPNLSRDGSLLLFTTNRLSFHSSSP